MNRKVKNTVPWTYVVSGLKGEEIVGKFYEKYLQKHNQIQFGIEKNLIERVLNYKSNGKVIIFHSMVIVKTK